MTTRMSAAWQIAPAPALFLTDEGLGEVSPFITNVAARQWAPLSGWWDAQWADLARSIAASAPAAHSGKAWQGSDSASGIAWWAVACDGGVLAWLHALKAHADRDEVQALREQVKAYTSRLAMAQELGRFGLWERDATSGDGWWDEHTARLFGRDEHGASANFSKSAQAVHPDDRALVNAAYARSMTELGDHEVHYRLLRPQGESVPVHARWRVEAGPDGLARRAIGIVFDETERLAELVHLHSSMQQLSMAGGLVGMDLWRIDLATQRIQLSDVGHALIGVAPDPRGVPLAVLREAIHPDDRAAVVRAAELALRSDTVVDVRARYLNRSGQYRDMLTRRVVQRDDRGQAVALVGVSLDLTDQEVERARTAAVAARMDLVAEATGIGVWSRNLDTGERDWNGRMRRLFEVPVDGPVPGLRTQLLKLVVDEDRHKVEQMTVLVAESARRARARRAAGGDSALVSSDSVVEVECRVGLAGGDLRWLVMRAQVLWVGEELWVHGVVIDVTEFRAAQAELQVARSRVELSAQAAGLGTWEFGFDPPTYRWDAQMYHLRGLRPDDPRSIPALIEALPPPEDDPRLVGLKLAELQRNKGVYSNEFRVCWPDGSVHWLASRGTALLDAKGEVGRVVGINWDITEQKRAEQMLRDKLMAEEANRAKSEFLARMSHELRTPLNAVLGFAELLCNAPREHMGEAERAKAGLIRNAGRHLLALIDDVLDLARTEASPQPVSCEAVSLDAVLADVMRWVQIEARVVSVSVKALASGLWVQADPRSLRQVFSNLLSNGIKYNRPGGQVQVLATVEAAPPPAVSGPSTPGRAPDRPDLRWVQVRVRDTGRGLNSLQLAHAFEPFNRLGAEEGEIPGTGIGLAIVRQLVLRMGGGIDVSSTPGEGTEFRFWLPLGAPVARAEAGMAATTALSEAPAAQKTGPTMPPQRTAIYIEDNPVNLLLVGELFACRPGWQLHTAVTGAEGVSEALRLHPDLALIDMQLPDIDGLQVLQRLRAEPALAQMRCIALSANAMPMDVERARDAGFDDYWTKPIDFQAFLSALDALAAAEA